MREYSYGAYGHIGDSEVKTAILAGTVPVYIGVAAINLIRGFESLELVNVPIKISNLNEAKNQVGYTMDWSFFTISEPIKAHFDNKQGNVGPIYVINVLDPITMKKAVETTIELTFSNGYASFMSSLIILDTFVIEDKVEGVDFKLEYDFSKGMVKITSLDKVNPLVGSLSSSFFEVDITKVTEEEIIGLATEDGEFEGIGALQLIYPRYNVVPNIIAAPKWSKTPEVYAALVEASKKINGHWDAFVFADIPILDGAAIDTIAKAITWKNAKQYNSERAKVFWPMFMDPDENIFHLSTLVAAEALRVDLKHNSIPFETPAGKSVPVVKQYFGEAATSKGYDQQTANLLAKEGITTAVFWSGNWVIWGDHTAAYKFDESEPNGTTIDPRGIFDTSMRMLMHISNSFQIEWGMQIDKPMTLQLKDTIINREQEKLDALVSIGALIGSPVIAFLEESNSLEGIVNGRFIWNLSATPTPPFKSGSLYVTYTNAGFSSYFGGE
jgi:hypothetical protein